MIKRVLMRRFKELSIFLGCGSAIYSSHTLESSMPFNLLIIVRLTLPHPFSMELINYLQNIYWRTIGYNVT